MAKIISHKPDGEFYPIEFDKVVVERVNLRIYPNFCLYYVEEGRIRYVLNRKEFFPATGDMFLVFSNMAVTLEPEPGTVASVLELGGGRVAPIFERVGITVAAPVIKKIPDAIKVSLCEFSSAADRVNPAADLVAQCQLYGFAAQLLDTYTRVTTTAVAKGKQMAEALQYISDNYMNPKFSIVDIANYMDFNANYMSRKFKEFTGKSFSKYLIEVRLNHACTLIREGIHSIKRVAELTGYSSQLYFSKEFKKEIGCTPKEYRARYK